MKEKLLIDALGQIDESYIEEASPENDGSVAKKRPYFVRFGILAACLALLFIGSIPIINQHNRLPLSDASEGVSVSYLRFDKILPQSAQSLIELTEEELFTHFTTAIFSGTITKLDNIVINYRGDKDYRAVAQIQVEQVYRGSCKAGDTVSVLLPCPVGNGIYVSDTDTVALMTVGMKGIFMPVVYDSDSVRMQNGATLHLLDIADYGFADGCRYAFLETEDGLVFSKWAYKSIQNATTLEEIEAYILAMLEKLH